MLDPVVSEWNHLDAEYCVHWSARKFTSPYLERILEHDTPSTHVKDQQIRVGNFHIANIQEYAVNDFQLSPQNSKRRGHGTVFDAGTPGIPSMLEVQQSSLLGTWDVIFPSGSSICVRVSIRVISRLS